MKLEKAAKKFEGARSPYMLATGKKAWYRKEGNKWKYDSMVTPAEEKDWEEAWAKKKKLKEMKAKTAATEAKLKTQAQQLQQQAAAKKASGPSKAEIEAAGSRSKLYYDPTTTERAKKLCDMTGILCLDKTAEDYVEGNLRTIFEMSADQKKEMRGMNPMYPLDTDGKFSEDPVFMEDTLIALRKYKKEVVDTGKWKEQAKDQYVKQQGQVDGGTLDYVLSKEEEGLKDAVNEWIDAIERHENDKLLMGKMRTLEQSLTGARVIEQLPTIVAKSLIPEMYGPNVTSHYGRPNWDDIVPEAQNMLNTLGFTKEVYEARTSSFENEQALQMIILCALHPDAVEMLQPWFKGAEIDQPQKLGGGKKWIPGGANVERPNDWIKYTGGVIQPGAGYWDYDIFKNGARILQKKYAAQSSMLKKLIEVENPGALPEYEWDEYGSSHEGVIHAPLDRFITGQSRRYNGKKGTSLTLQDASWSSLVDTAKELGKATTSDDAKKVLDSISETGKMLGKVALSATAMEAHKMMDTYYKHLSAPMKEQIKYDESHMTQMVGWSKETDPLKLKPVNLPTTGFIGYKMVRRHPEYGMAYAGTRRGYRRGGAVEAETFGETAKLKQALKQKFFMRFSAMSGNYSRERHLDLTVHPEHHSGASILAAIGTNWQVRKLAKKAQAIPDWRWGDAIPYGANNPIPIKGDDRIRGSEFTKSMFDKLVTDARNTSIAANIGLMKKELKTAVQTGVRRPDIVLRTNADGPQKWQDKIDKEWTHGADFPVGSMKVNAVFDVMYHPYYDKYKALEAQRGNVQYAWHGTDFEAGSKIIKTGYYVSAHGKTGRSLGNGTYVSTSSSKVGGYFLRGSWGRGGHGVMFWNRIAMGNVKDLQAGTVKGSAQGGQVHTSYAPGGYRFQHDEHCIHSDTNQYNYALVPIQWVDVGPK